MSYDNIRSIFLSAELSFLVGQLRRKKWDTFPSFPVNFVWKWNVSFHWNKRKITVMSKKIFKKKKKKNCQNRRKLESKIDEVKMTRINGKCKMRLFSGDFQTVWLLKFFLKPNFMPEKRFKNFCAYRPMLLGSLGSWFFLFLFLFLASFSPMPMIFIQALPPPPIPPYILTVGGLNTVVSRWKWKNTADAFAKLSLLCMTLLCCHRSHILLYDFDISITTIM